MAETAIEQEIARLATALDMDAQSIRAELERIQATKEGMNINTALGRFKKDNDFLLKRVQDTYRIWPLSNGTVRTTEVNGVTRSVVDILGVFYGKVTRTGQPQGFMLNMSLWDDDIQAAEPIIGQKGPFAFKGSLDTYKQKLYLKKGSEFVADDGKKIPRVEEIVKQITDSAMPLVDLLKTNDKGDFIYDGVELLVRGTVADARLLDSGKCVLTLSDIGSDNVTVWAPDGVSDFGEEDEGNDVLVYGYHKVKDTSVINAKTILRL